MSTTSPTYSVHVSCASDGLGDTDVTITRDIPAGICGPFDSFKMAAEGSMGDVSAAVEARGFEPVALDAWKVRTNYEGLTLSADLTRAA